MSQVRQDSEPYMRQFNNSKPTHGYPNIAVDVSRSTTSKKIRIEHGIIIDERTSRLALAPKAHGDVLSLCYPLIEVDDRGYVGFCHSTAHE